MLVEFDQTTIDNMTTALSAVCKKIPPEKDSYELRKRIADTMVECAQSSGRATTWADTSCPEWQLSHAS